MYPKCRSGFKAFGCCVCTPQCPSGMTDIGVSCAKRSYGRTAGKTMACGSGLVNDAGLCYRPCRRGTTGVGPVCWANSCPSEFPVACGAACATSSAACAESITNQVTTSLEMVSSITGIVFSGGASAGPTVAKQTIKNQLRRKAREIGKELAEETLENAATTFFEAQLTGEFRWTDLDPTGIANVIAAFYKPLCVDYE